MLKRYGRRLALLHDFVVQYLLFLSFVFLGPAIESLSVCGYQGLRPPTLNWSVAGFMLLLLGMTSLIDVIVHLTILQRQARCVPAVRMRHGMVRRKTIIVTCIFVFLGGIICYFRPTLLSAQGYGYVSCPIRTTIFLCSMWWLVVCVRFLRNSAVDTGAGALLSLAYSSLGVTFMCGAAMIR